MTLNSSCPKPYLHIFIPATIKQCEEPGVLIGVRGEVERGWDAPGGSICSCAEDWRESFDQWEGSHTADDQSELAVGRPGPIESVAAMELAKVTWLLG